MINEKILALRRRKAEIVEQMRSLISKADEEERVPSEDENKRFSELEESIKPINEAIDKEERLMALEGEIVDKNGNEFTASKKPEKTEDRGFANLGEFFYTIAANRNDPRLRGTYQKEERATQQMGVGVLGGFAVPDRFIPDLLKVDPQEAVIRSRATVIEAGDPPDSEVNIPALDQSTSENIYGGVVVYHQGESATLTETDARLRNVTLKPKKITGFMKASNELLLNWAAASTFLQTQMRLAITGQEDYDFLRGDGANKATGVINADCRVNYSRATASTIVFADVSGMFARARMGNNLVWVASQTTIPQLVNIRDTGNSNLWVTQAANGLPNTMFGFPVIFDERSPALGSVGDLVLCDLSYYLIKNGSGPRVDVSTEYAFNTDETCFRIVWYVDGNAWLNTAIALEGSSSDTVSPFVVLN